MDNRNLLIKEVFDLTVKLCKRSTTKKCGTHTNPLLHRLLADALQKVGIRFGVEICNEYKKEFIQTRHKHESLFAHVTNYMIEKAFQIGSCQLQAEVALFEFFKRGVFNISLATSTSGDVNTNHVYLMIHEGNNNDIYFDTWADQYCKWSELKPDPDNKYLKDLKTKEQLVDMPLLEAFTSEVTLLENIILCFTEYENRLDKLTLIKYALPEQLLFFSVGEDFLKEMKFLYDFPSCREVLLDFVANEKRIFEERLATVKQVGNLFEITAGFFKKKPPAQWKAYPKNVMEKNPKYAGHDVRFFTFPANDFAIQQTNEFLVHLEKHGLSAESKVARNKSPSLIVDLTASINTRGRI